MAARTASVTGKWSDTATWGGAAVPVDGDTITINAGVLVEFDVDQSGFANGLGTQTINGTLWASRTAGSYVWKCNGAVTFGAAASFLVNDGAGGNYPSNCTFEKRDNVAFNTNFSSTTVVDIRCNEPTHRWCKLSSSASAGATVLNVDTDLTGASDSGLWATNNLVNIDNINQAKQSERRTISSVSSTQITISAGLTASKAQGAYILLISRNVKIVAAGSGQPFIGFGAAYVYAEVRGTSNNLINGTNSATVPTLGGVWADALINGLNNGIFNGVMTGATGISGYNCTVNGLISGCTNGIASASSCILASGAIITGCDTGIFASNDMTIMGQILNCGTGFGGQGGSTSRCESARIIGATFSNNTRDMRSPVSGLIVNTLFGSGTEFFQYTQFSGPYYYLESIDHDQVVGALRAWSLGGIVTSVATPTFDASRVRSYQHAPESASNYVFMQKTIWLPPGKTLSVTCYVRKTVSMSYLPRLWIFSADKEPFIAGSPDVEAIMTNSTDTWETLSGTITNSTDSMKPYIVRTIAKNASGNVYFDPVITPGSGGSVMADMVGGLTG